MSNLQLEQALLNAERLKILEELALIGEGDDSFELIYDRITNLASIILHTPVVLITLVTGNDQFFKSYTGLPEPWKSKRSTPLSHSFCKHVVATDTPLIVNDAREVDFLKDNEAIEDLDVIAYIGMPIKVEGSEKVHTLGSFCIIDSQSRLWRDTDIEIVRQFAEIISHEIDLKAKARLDERYAPRLEALHERINTLIDKVDVNLSHQRLLQQIKHLRNEHDA